MSPTEQKDKLGTAGKIASAFVTSKLTPLIVIASLLLGLLAIAITPREEEPQILVPMVDVMIPYTAGNPRDVEEQVTTPIEKLFWGIKDVEYIYSVSQPGMALVTLRFKVGTQLEDAVLRVHHKFREHMNQKPANIGEPLVRSYTIDDVPFFAVTLHSKNKSDYHLRQIANEFSRELAEITDISSINAIGGEPRQVKIIPDPNKLAQNNVSLLELFKPLMTTKAQGMLGKTEGTNPEFLVELKGGAFRSAKEISEIVVGIKGGRTVKLSDVATVIDGPQDRTQQVLFATKDGTAESAITLAFSKRPGTNATSLAEKTWEKIQLLEKSILKDKQDVSLTITRNYGETAKEKSDTLIEHLLIASFSVVILIALFLGIRFSLVVGIAVPVTLALTLMIYYLFGYTLNRVTLFALIFSIGILVDDAIVVVENVHRHLHDPKLSERKSLPQIIINAINEVGNPTILATVTVIAAILPMAFVTGLMGPYMRPIPIGASVAMIFSLIIAFTISAWASLKTHVKPFEKGKFCLTHTDETPHKQSKLDKLYEKIMGNILDKKKYKASFLGVIIVMFVVVVGMVYFKVVRVKMLPFDNKSEFQVVVDMPEGTPLNQSLKVAKELGNELQNLEELTNYQIYLGTSAPINFNGLVRHYFLRNQPYQFDIQVNLTDKHDRERQSHDIAKSIRPNLDKIGKKYNARIKVVEIPPGPPVMSTLVSEIYGPNHKGQIEVAKKVMDVYENTEGIVDIDWSVEDQQNKYELVIDRKAASLRRLPVDSIYAAIGTALTGHTLGILKNTNEHEPVNVVLRLDKGNRKDLETILELKVPTDDFSFVALKDVVRLQETKQEHAIYHKNLQRVVYVFGDVAGAEESPVYALQNLSKKIDQIITPDNTTLKTLSISQPEVTDHYSMKWDGEWQITYEVFRDMGIAFAIVLILIYIIVVGWFESFLVPIVIMLPIPISLIGIIPGHWLFGSFFTATSMIGFIAGAGIIVRNSIILVDFIELNLKQGMPLKEAVILAGEVRFRPMLLTAAAVVVGAFVILFDPIFQGLAISLMMGEVAATILSRFAVPLAYYKIAGRLRERVMQKQC